MNSERYNGRKFERYALTDAELRNVFGGMEIKNESTYKLTLEEAFRLKNSGYELAQTSTGDYVIKNKDGTSPDSSEIKNILEKFCNKTSS